MNSAPTSTWRNYLLSAVLLAIIVLAALWGFGVGVAVQSGLPSVNTANAIFLIVIGFAAGVLGGIIGTGGCSVMLPAIHF
jgi:hypothetical protein